MLMKVKNILIPVVLLLIMTSPINAQDGRKGYPSDLGFEVQGYPGGFIFGTRFEKAFTNRDAINFKLGYNFAFHRDLGVHEDERGGGPGFTIGYRHYFKDDAMGVFFGVKNDIWINTIDWKDNIGETNEISGTTEITVIQPTLEGGYLFITNNDYWSFAPTIAFGFEINVNQKGEDVGSILPVHIFH